MSTHADQIQELKDIGEIAELSGWDPAGSKVKKMIEACNNKFSALRKGISTGPLAPGAAVKLPDVVGLLRPSVRASLTFSQVEFLIMYMSTPTQTRRCSRKTSHCPMLPLHRPGQRR